MTMQNPNVGMGFGQSWQNVQASRAAGTVYYNTTPKPIMVAVAMNASGSSSTMVFGVNGINGYGNTAVSIGNVSSAQFIVPPGGSYSVTMNVGTPAINSWMELR